MKKIFLTSAICMIVAMPSYADIASGASSATCDSTTIGATEDSTDLEALWTAAQYTEPAGQYLLFANNTVSQHQTCPAGSYCPGFTNQTFADASMGLQTCPTGYASSAAGASADTQCYRACSGNVTIAHATGVTGNDYYGNGTDTCAPTGCDAGYHVKAAVTAPDLNSIIGTTAGTGFGWKSNDGTNTENIATYGITQNGEFVVDYGNKGRIHGLARCSSRGATDWQRGGSSAHLDAEHFVDDITDETDLNIIDPYESTNCYCKLDGYTPSDGTMQAISAPWVFRYDQRDPDDEGTCSFGCAYRCAEYLRNQYNNVYNQVYRLAVFESIKSSPAMCEANTITIDWDPKNGGAHTQNQCTYGGAVTIPATPSKPGYIFGGWKVKTN